MAVKAVKSVEEFSDLLSTRTPAPAPDTAPAPVSDTAPTPTSKRKRDEIAPPPAEFEERGRKRSRLTADNLARLNRQMGDRSSSRQDELTRSRSSRRSLGLTTTTDKALAGKLEGNGVIVGPRISPSLPVPDDLSEILARLSAERRSPPPSEADYENHVLDVETSIDESAVITVLWNSFPGKKPREYSRMECSWKAFADCPLATVSEGISPPKPDWSEYRVIGTEMYPLEALEVLDGLIRPTPGSDLAMPHLVVELKSRRHTAYTALHQAAYDGACIVLSDMHAYEYAVQPFPYNKLRALSIRYNGQELRIDGHFSIGQGRECKFHILPLAVFHPDESFEQYKSAQKAVRNAQDFGREKTEEILQLLRSAPTRPGPGSEGNLPSPMATEDQPPRSVSASSAKRRMPPPTSVSSTGGSSHAAEQGKGRGSASDSSKRGRQV